MKKTILSILSILAGAVAATVILKKVMGKTTEAQRNRADKNSALFLMMNRWVAAKQEGKNLADYLKKMGYKTIAIYGMGHVGERLLEELRGSVIEVKYGIDRNVKDTYSDISICNMEDKMEPVDAVVVTPIVFFDEIEGQLLDKFDCPILSLGEILDEI